jgi:hypothetical protein
MLLNLLWRNHWMTDAKSQRWYRLYVSAAAELDRKRLIERVDLAEAVIYGRLPDLHYHSDHHEKASAIADAQHFLARYGSTMRHKTSPSMR